MTGPNCIAGFIVDDVVATPNPIPDPIRSLRENHELIEDLCRFAENLTSESAIRRKWRLGEEMWEALGADDELVRAIEETKTRRLRSGATKRELAQAHVIRGPTVLASIMDDTRANARHRVDSVKALDALAANGPGAATEQDRIVIRIDLSADERAKGQEPNPAHVLTIEAEARPSTPKQIDNHSLRRRDDDRDNDF